MSPQRSNFSNLQPVLGERADKLVPEQEPEENSVDPTFFTKY